jgi:hypothetical protein
MECVMWVMSNRSAWPLLANINQTGLVAYSIIERKPLNAKAGDWGNDEQRGECVFLLVTLNNIHINMHSIVWLNLRDHEFQYM